MTVDAPAPDWQRFADLSVPAGQVRPPDDTLYDYVQSRVDWAAEIPTSLLRGAVAATTLAIGQLALGVTDHRAIAQRSVAGAMIGEVGAIATRVATEVSGRQPTDRAVLEGMLLYGEETAALYAARFAAARRGELGTR